MVLHPARLRVPRQEQADEYLRQPGVRHGRVVGSLHRAPVLRPQVPQVRPAVECRPWAHDGLVEEAEEHPVDRQSDLVPPTFRVREVDR